MATDSSLAKSLAEVFDLILFNVDRIVDDTSLEKLLEIIEFLYNSPNENKSVVECTILKFFGQVVSSHVVEWPEATISFALRLSGIMCNSSGGFRVISTASSTLEYLFHQIFEKEELWADPGVRDSFFKAALAILRSNDGFLWIQNSGVLQQAMECLVDSSIFVAECARKFVAKYLVSLYNSSINEKQMENGLQASAKHDCFTAKTDTFSLELKTCYKCIIYHLKHVVEQSPMGLARAMSRQVSVTQLLLSLIEEDAISAQEMLHPSGVVSSCFKTLTYINKDECGKVIDVIFTMLNNTSTWQINWTFLLNLQDKQDLFDKMFEFILILYKRLFVFHSFQLIQGVFQAGQFLQFDEHGLCVLFMLLSFPLHATLHKIEESNHVECQDVKDVARELLTNGNEGYKIVHQILNGTSKDFLSSSAVVQSLTVTTDLVCDMKFQSYPRLAGFIRAWCKDIIEFLNEQPADYFRRNTLTKFFIKAVTVCCDRDLFDDDTIFDGKKEFYRLLEKLMFLSQDSKIISDCFEGIKCLFSKTDPVFPCYVNIETLNKLLLLHCSNTSWDVRDSTLIFLQFLLSTFNAANIELLLDRNLLLVLWKLMEDNESYVRASSLYLLAALSAADNVWRYFCQTISLSEEEVLNYIVNSFEEEEAAFARRATIDIFSLWLERKHKIILLQLEETSFTPVRKVLDKASQDFDWEVKLCVLNFWEIMLRHVCEEAKKTLSFIESSCLNGIGSVIFGAITDCDQPVRVKGLALLEELKTRLVGPLENDGLHYNGLVDELHDFIVQIKKDRNRSLLQTLLAIDFSQFVTGFQEGNLLQNPLPFFKDILAAASENRDNLLDCY